MRTPALIRDGRVTNAVNLTFTPDEWYLLALIATLCRTQGIARCNVHPTAHLEPQLNIQLEGPTVYAYLRDRVDEPAIRRLTEAQPARIRTDFFSEKNAFRLVYIE